MLAAGHSDLTPCEQEFISCALRTVLPRSLQQLDMAAGHVAAAWNGGRKRKRYAWPGGLRCYAAVAHSS